MGETIMAASAIAAGLEAGVLLGAAAIGGVLVIGGVVIAGTVVLVAKTMKKKQDPVAAEGVMVGYYASWAMYRNGAGKCTIADIDPNIFTHLIYAFADVGDDNKIKILEDNDMDNFKRFNDLKKENAKLITLLSVGGDKHSANFPKMAASTNTRRIFVDSCIELLKMYGFNGLDIDWEFPVEGHKRNFVFLLKDLSQALHANGMMLSAAVSASKSIIDDAYDVPGMAQHLDMLNLMSYDLHGPWDTYTHHHSALKACRQDRNKELNQDFAVSYWFEKGMPACKIALGVPLYGRTWTLQNEDNTGYYAPAAGPGEPGRYTRQPGFLGYNEICEGIKDGWTVVRDPAMNEPYVHSVEHNRIWCSYEDEDSVKIKAEYAKEKGLAGVMVWSIDTDDFRGTYGRKFNLIKTMRETC